MARRCRRRPRLLLRAARPPLVTLLLVLRRSPETQLSAALLLASTALAVYGGEAVLLYVISNRTVYGLPVAVADSACPETLEYRGWCALVVAAGGSFDPRTKLEFIRDLEAEGRPALPSFDAMSVKEAPLLSIGERSLLPLAPGVAGRLMVLCNEWGHWVSYTADERGFPNPTGLHRPDSVDVAVLGDSYAEGWCVEPNRTVVAQLRTRMPRSLNLGISGSGPLWQLGILREYAARIGSTKGLSGREAR